MRFAVTTIYCFKGLFLTIPPLVSLMLCVTTKASASILSISALSLLISNRVITVKIISVDEYVSPLLPYPFLPA